MEKEVYVSTYLDKRRKKANGKYPVKLRVYTPLPQKQKLYPTKFEFTEKEFEAIWETIKPRINHKDIRREIQAVENKALTTIESLPHFTFEQFERRLYRKKGEGSNVFHQYDAMIEEMRNKNRLNTASSYEFSAKSLKGYLRHLGRRNVDTLSFYEINKKWLEQYEQYMTEHLGRSETTVGIYLRSLRAVFNEAIDSQDIKKEVYPFGKGKSKYQIPSSRAVKKALSKEQLKRLYEAVPANEQQEKARDYWFLSFACQGINIKDIACLKFENLKDDSIEFYRAKTKNTSRSNRRLIPVPIVPLTRQIINKYGNDDKKKSNYIFSILESGIDETEKIRRVKVFTRFINQHIKLMAVANDLPSDISTYWARHSFSTRAIQSGANVEYVSEALGHSDIKTTQAYIDGFEDEFKREILEKLVDFD